MNVILRESSILSKPVIQIVQGDITREVVDAIVNAANSKLQHGSGLAGVISRRGGSIIQKESNHWVREHGQVSHEEPALTTGGKLDCKFVIHAVGPIWGSGDEDTKLAAAISGSFKKADSLGLKSIAIPAISTGIFGFPVVRAADITVKTIKKYAAEMSGSGIHLIRLVLYDQTSVESFLKIWDSLDPESSMV